MVEKLQADSEKSLEVHKDEVIKALAGEAGDPSSPGDDNPLATEAMTHAVGGSAFAVGMAVREDMATTNKNSRGSMHIEGKKENNAIFVNKGKIAQMPVSKTAKNDSLVSSVGTTRMSLLGTSSSGGKPVPIKGASISDKAAKMVRIAGLKNDLAAVTGEMEKAPDEGSKRTIEGDRKGHERDKTAIRRSSKNTAPQTPQSPPTPPQKGRGGGNS
jgi:hypothetical protein